MSKRSPNTSNDLELADVTARLEKLGDLWAVGLRGPYGLSEWFFMPEGYDPMVDEGRAVVERVCELMDEKDSEGSEDR